MSNEKENVRFTWENKIIKGFPELKWTGKKPYTSTEYFPAQLKEVYGEPDSNGWLNKIFWGDNLQVMSHLLKDYRGKINLIYIDPPFDSKADYKKTIQLHGKEIKNDSLAFEEKQYGDIWNNDDYLQFMYERLILMRELLAPDGSIFLHCDWHKVHHLRCLMDEVFGPEHLRNEIIWCYTGPGTPNMKQFNRKHDEILWYSKSNEWCFNEKDIRIPYKDPNQRPRTAFLSAEGNDFDEEAIEAMRERGMVPNDWWEMAVAARKRIDGVNRTGYPTEKPEELLTRIILAASKPGDIVFDCFGGSGVTAFAALKNGRRFITADINLGALQLMTMRFNKELDSFDLSSTYEKAGFEVFNVNNYDFFRNPIQARSIILDLLNIDTFATGNVFDGEKDGRMYKLMPLTRIATKSDLNAFIENLPYSLYEKRKEENPDDFVDHITIVCMGHEPDLLGAFKQETQKYKIDIEIYDVLLEKRELQLKREAEAKIVKKGNKLVIESFYPMNLMQKLSLQKETVKDWKQLVDSIFIDWNYDGNVFKPTMPDVPAEIKYMVKGEYNIPPHSGKIRVKITDVLSESIEVDVE